MPVVLVPLDGSAFAEQALPWAVVCARRTNARLLLASAYEPAAHATGEAAEPGGDWRYATRLRGVLERYLDQTRARLAQAEPSLTVDTALLDGQPAASLARHARDVAADLVVVTTHGHGGLTRLWLGGVADALLRDVESDVLVVRPREDEGPPSPPAIARIVVALDGTPEGAYGADAAVSLGGEDGVTYLLVHVVTPLHPLVRALVSDEEVDRDRADEVRRAERFLLEVQQRLRSRGVECRPVVQVSANISRALLSEAAEGGAQMIVLASKRRGPMGRLMLGSVADRVVRQSDVPVLLARPRG